MNTMNVIAGLAAVSFGAIALNASATISSGRCPTTNTSGFDCMEWTDSGPWYHTTQNDWFGPGGTSGAGDTFPFTGETSLRCGVGLDCTLTLNGQARMNTETGDDFSIRVIDGSVTGGILCGLVDLNFDPYWYADDDSEETTWDDNSFISDPGTLAPYTGFATGSIGNINFAVSALGINISNGHMHNVQFHNNGVGSPGSYFAFDGPIYNPGHVESGCEISGDLYYNDANAW